MVVSGGGTNSDLQQAARRALGDPNNERDGAEKAMPWIGIGLAAAVLIAVVVTSITGDGAEGEGEASFDRAEAAAIDLEARAREAGLTVDDRDAARAAGAHEATIVVATDAGSIAVTWLQPPGSDLLVEVHERDEVEGASIEVGEGGDRLPRAVLDCGRSNVMISGELGLDADPADRQHRDPDGIDPAALHEVAEALAAQLDCPARMPSPSA